jgi:hypothetical protein
MFENDGLVILWAEMKNMENYTTRNLASNFTVGVVNAVAPRRLELGNM